MKPGAPGLVVIAGDFGFPDGGAPAARVRNLALGFRAAGIPVHVIAMSDACGSDKAEPYESLGDGLTVERPPARYSRDRRSNRGLFDRLKWMSSVYRASWSIARRFRKNNLTRPGDLCILYGRSYLRLAPLLRAARSKRMTTLLDVVEGVERFSGWGGALNPVYWDWRVGAVWLPRQTHGVLAITHGLAERCRRYGARHLRILPAIESWPLPHSNQSWEGPRRLLHVGALLRKDAPSDLANFVKAARAAQLPIEIRLAGRYAESVEGRRWLTALQCADAGPSAIVRPLGELTAEQLQQEFEAAHGFLLFRSTDVAEQLSFPTRLVEYLRWAKPVFVTGTGDIVRYLQDGRDAVLLPAANAEGAVARAAPVLADAAAMARIGAAGWVQGRLHFDRDTHAAEVLDWLRVVSE